MEQARLFMQITYINHAKVTILGQVPVSMMDKIAYNFTYYTSSRAYLGLDLKSRAHH